MHAQISLKVYIYKIFAKRNEARDERNKNANETLNQDDVARAVVSDPGSSSCRCQRCTYIVSAKSSFDDSLRLPLSSK